MQDLSAETIAYLLLAANDGDLKQCMKDAQAVCDAASLIRGDNRYKNADTEIVDGGLVLSEEGDEDDEEEVKFGFNK